jgi:hypothetical protein
MITTTTVGDLLPQLRSWRRGVKGVRLEALQNLD